MFKSLKYASNSNKSSLRSFKSSTQYSLFHLLISHGAYSWSLSKSNSKSFFPFIKKKNQI